MRAYRRTKAKLDNLLERLTWEQPMTAERRNAWQKIRASGFRQFIWRRVLIGIGTGIIFWGIIGMFGYGLEWHKLIKDLIRGAAIGSLIGWSGGYRNWVHNEGDYLNWPTLEPKITKDKGSSDSNHA
jgi:hypothetical protein